MFIGDIITTLEIIETNLEAMKRVGLNFWAQTYCNTALKELAPLLKILLEETESPKTARDMTNLEQEVKQIEREKSGKSA